MYHRSGNQRVCHQRISLCL